MKIRQNYDELVIEGVDTISELNTFYIQNTHKFGAGVISVTPKAYQDYCFKIWQDEVMSRMLGILFKAHPVGVECHVDHPGLMFRGVELKVV